MIKFLPTIPEPGSLYPKPAAPLLLGI